MARSNIILLTPKGYFGVNKKAHRRNGGLFYAKVEWTYFLP